MRFDPLRKTVKNFIENEELGEIYHVNLSYDFSSFFSIKRNGWTNNISLGGGVLNSMGSHQLDLLVWWLGKIHNISFGQKHIKNKSSKNIILNSSDNITKGLINFNNGSLTNFSVSNASIGWKNSKIEIYGSKAALFINGEKEMNLHRSTGAYHNYRFDSELLSKGWVGGSIWRAAFFRQIEELSLKIIDKKNLFHGSTFEEASYIRKIMDTIQSQNNNKKFQTIK
jgi:predicted dehydrogenase